MPTARKARRRQPTVAQRPARAARASKRHDIPKDRPDVTLTVEGGEIRLSNLQKVFWPKLNLYKRDLLQYYLDIAPWLLPHVKDRAMVMKRYPNGASGEFFFMKRAPSPRPASVPICSIEHHAGVIDFPIVQNTASLLWVVNLGCIDLNPWYSRCDDVDRPDFMNFDLDPVTGSSFDRVRHTALIVRDALAELGITSYAKTSGSRGIHVYVPIARGPKQKQVWTFAKSLAVRLAQKHPGLITSEYRIAKRPEGHVLVDYNQNAWNRTLASVYSVRPTPNATVSMPVTWEEIETGVEVEDFTITTVPQRLTRIGDLWKPLLQQRGRTNLAKLL